MKKKLLKILIVLICGMIIGTIPGIVTKCEAREKGHLYNPLTLSEKEMNYWNEIYSSAIKSGKSNPGLIANEAILELRKMNGDPK